MHVGWPWKIKSRGLGLLSLDIEKELKMMFGEQQKADERWDHGLQMSRLTLFSLVE
jgi:hypothetical protein